MRIAVCMVAVALALASAGCATVQSDAKTESPRPVASHDEAFAIRNQGYSLLYQLMSDEKNVSKILLIKKEQTDTGEILRRISETAGAAAKQMETFEKSDPHLHLQMDGLPTAERETRDLIAKTRTKELLTKGGEKFDLRILLTQSEALTYGAHLAVVAESHETDAARKNFLAELSQNLQNLHQSVIDLMHTRWKMPEPVRARP